MGRTVSLFLTVFALFHPWSHPVAGQQGSASRPESAIPDSIRQDLADGRYWRASLALRAHLDPIVSASLQDRMVLADAETGWRNWDGAVRALSLDASDTAQAPPRLWYLLGTALQASGDDRAAAAALSRFLHTAPGGSPAGLVGRSRLARALAETGSPGDAVETVGGLRALSRPLGDWTALAVARTLAAGGEAEAVRRLLALIVDPATRRRGWALEADAWAAAGDTARALEALAGIAVPEEGPPTRTDILGRDWRYRLALGDTAGAVAAMEELLGWTSRGSAALDAAMTHWRVATNSGPEILRRVAIAMGSGGEFALAVRAWRVAMRAGAVLSEGDRLTLARAYNGSGDHDQAVREYRELAASEDPATAATALQAWAGVRQRQGRRGDMRTLEDRLVERFPSSPEAVDVVFFRGDIHQDAGRLGEAVDHYRRATSMSSSVDRAGLARMRWGQIHLARGESAAAAEVFQGYLENFPDGRRREEASYWGARAAAEAGDSARARLLLARIREESPLSYYAFLAAEVDGAPFALDLADPRPPLPDPEWLSRELEALALLEDAGLDEGADAHVAAMKAAVWDSDELLLHLAGVFNRRGRTVDGIRLGFELRRRGRAWDQTLLRAVYPFPYQELVTARAEELGLDPYLVAGIIRQESAFSPAVVSAAGAIGLMQVMPATGNQLAASIGPRGFRTESLETPELNVHLGTRFLADLIRRYDGDTTLVLSAYNAGPTRANRWRRFPEAADARRFTERIPFAETRGYVKNVVRNRALYRWLYGEVPSLDAPSHAPP